MDHEGLLLSLARGHQGIGPLLETFFSFLAHRTDFFHILEEGGASMGFAIAAAEAMVAEAFGKAQLSYRLAKQRHLLPPHLRDKNVKDLLEMTRDFNSKQQSCRLQYASPVCRLAVISSPPDFLLGEKTPAPPAQSSPAAVRPQRQEAALSSSTKQTIMEKRQTQANEPESDSSSHPTALPVSATQQGKAGPDGSDHNLPGATRERGSTGASKNERKALLISPWNGAILDRYVWSQSISEVTCQLRLLEVLQQQQEKGIRDEQKPMEVDSKHVCVTLRDDSVQVAYEGNLVFEGRWAHPIRSSESFWVLEQKAFLLFTLEKKRELWWECLIEGDPTIDTTKVESVKRVEDFDEATQGHIRKIVFEQRLKMQGLKTPEEIQQENILRQAWDLEGSPFKGQPFDPSVLKSQPFGPEGARPGNM